MLLNKSYIRQNLVREIKAKMVSVNHISGFLNQPFLQSKFTNIKDWSKTFWFGMIKNGFGQSGLWALNLTLSPEWTDDINWFFACWHKFRKSKSWFNDFRVGMVKHGQGFLVHETLKSWEWIYELSWLFDCQKCLMFSFQQLYFFGSWSA